MTQWYYWLTMRKDATFYLRKCDKCQRYAQVPYLLLEDLTNVSSPWSFIQRGLDILGQLPFAPAQKWYIFIAIDYFNKLVEAELYYLIKDNDVIKFI